MYLTVTDANQKSGIITTEDLLNTATNCENNTAQRIFWYTLITYLIIIVIFIILYIIDECTEFSISDAFNNFHGNLPGYGIVISILAMIPTIVTYVVSKKSYKNWHERYIHSDNLKTLPCFKS
jgi:hypothetical protein